MNVIRGVSNARSPSVLAPDSNIKGRLLTSDEGCGLSKSAIKRIVSGAPAKKGFCVDHFDFIGLNEG